MSSAIQKAGKQEKYLHANIKGIRKYVAVCLQNMAYYNGDGTNPSDKVKSIPLITPQGDILIPNILTNEMADDALAGVAVAVGVDCVRHGVVIV